VRPGDGRDRPGVGPAVAVKHRQGPQVSGLVVHLDLDDVAQSADVSVAVVVHHALWLPRRPGGVVYGDHLLLVLQDALHRLRRAFGQVVLVRVALLAGVVDAHDLDALVYALQQLLQLVVHEDHLGLGVLDDVLDLACPQAGVYGDHY
jgi:hypothetical protein